ncbi:MAG: four helix bundle protein [Terrimicrobiaceae bacterium]|nr:four helix bundle protein [Terrimicrobiaceae bacterium]
MKYTKRTNLNRGYMKLDVWQRGMDLFAMVFEQTSNVRDWKLQSQVRDAAQSVSANISEGYGRRTLPEYLQFLYIAKGSLAECLTRGIGLHRVGLFNGAVFEQFDTLHYEVENKLIHLILALEEKRGTTEWSATLPHSSTQPLIHSSAPPAH